MALAAATALTLLNIALPANGFILPRATNTSMVTVPLGNIGNQYYTAGVKMGEDQEFGFALNLNTGYTVVAGNNCQNCVTNSSLPKYDPSKSSTFVQDTSGGGSAATVQTSLGGKPISGALGQENCALQRADGTWWSYPNQTVIVAGSDSDSQALGPVSGVAGFGQTNTASSDQTLLGQYLAGHTDLSSLTFGIALNPISSSGAGSDSDGGSLHIFQPDSSFYTGTVSTLPVANSNQQSNFGSVPTQIGSYDWTVQMQGWTFTPGPNQQAITGGGGVYTTVEAAYPYIVLTAADAQKIYSAISGAQQYTIPANAQTSNGLAVGQDSSVQSYSIPCSTSGLTLSVSFGGVTIPIDPSDLYTNIGGVCVGNVKGWTDSSRATYLFGTAFLRNAYLIFTANPNQQSNTIGFAVRAFQSKSSKSNVGAIVGGVVGGLAFIALVAVASYLFIRHRRKQNEVAPSAAFASTGEFSGGASTSEKHHSFLGFISKDRNAENLAAEPWTPPPGTTNGMSDGGHHQSTGGDVVVQPWQPNAPGEQAFLSPTGTAFPGTSSSPAPTSTTGYAMSPPPPSTSPAYTASTGHGGIAQALTPPPRSPGVAYDQPPNGTRYSPVPNPTGQAMWVERV